MVTQVEKCLIEESQKKNQNKTKQTKNKTKKRNELK